MGFGNTLIDTSPLFGILYSQQLADKSRKLLVLINNDNSYQSYFELYIHLIWWSNVPFQKHKQKSTVDSVPLGVSAGQKYSL